MCIILTKPPEINKFLGRDFKKTKQKNGSTM